MGENVSRMITCRDQEDTRTPISDLCNDAWESHNWRLKDEEDFDPGWELILDDVRQIELTVTTSKFLAHFSDLIENLFLGCKEAMSDEVHQDFVDLIVNQTENIIQEEYTNGKTEVFCKEVPLYLNKEDALKNRKTQMVFLMVIRISNSPSKERTEREAKWESFIKLQLSSDMQKYPIEQPRRCCRENQWQLPSNYLLSPREFASLDPT